ncbi:MAG: pyridoxal-phosphate dependent enzyme [Deltaproteobacteria bacterium]|nr:pyridoxal-phosphate dependent enzyme [Deltaproteobacteria bacterium]
MTRSLEQVAMDLSQFYHRVSLGTFPTPVARISLAGIKSDARIWIKSDDKSSRIYGGNKSRKLEFILGQSRRPVLTFGPLGSHHVYATAMHARALCRQTAAVLVPQHMTPHHELVHTKILKLCSPVVTLSASPLALAAQVGNVIELSKRGPMGYQICPPGGTSPIGTLGYVVGALELAAQIAAGQLPVPAKIFVPLGTGGTSVGIAIGMAMAGLVTETVAVRVVPELALPKISLAWLMAGTLRLIRKAGLNAPSKKDIRFSIRNGFSKKYAVTNPAADNAMQLARQAGIELETTYSAKTMAALIADATGAARPLEPLLFWQTFADVAPSL